MRSLFLGDLNYPKYNSQHQKMKTFLWEKTQTKTPGKLTYLKKKTTTAKKTEIIYLSTYKLVTNQIDLLKPDVKFCPTTKNNLG